MTIDLNEQRLNEGGPEAVRPEDTLSGMSSDRIRAELFEMLDDMGVNPPQGFSAARNEQVRALMASLTPFKTDGGPMTASRRRMTRVLTLILELRSREMRAGA